MKRIAYMLAFAGVAMCGMECAAQTVSGKEGGHDYVDLGLPSGTKWATCNVGASGPTGYGDHFAWGETKSKINYTWPTYKWCENKKLDELDSPLDFTKYCTNSKYGTVDNKNVLEPEDDAACVNWGNGWRMPTAAEVKELLENCAWDWTTDFAGTGVAGRVGTSNINGNTIFLPAAGFRYEAARSGGGYWSSSLNDDYSDYAIAFDIHDSQVESHDDRRSYSRTVRAVIK